MGQIWLADLLAFFPIIAEVHNNVAPFSAPKQTEGDPWLSPLPPSPLLYLARSAGIGVALT